MNTILRMLGFAVFTCVIGDNWLKSQCEPLQNLDVVVFSETQRCLKLCVTIIHITLDFLEDIWIEVIFCLWGLTISYTNFAALSHAWTRSCKKRFSRIGMCIIYENNSHMSLSSASLVPESRGSLGHHRRFHNQFSPFLPVLHCPLGLAELHDVERDCPQADGDEPAGD